MLTTILDLYEYLNDHDDYLVTENDFRYSAGFTVHLRNGRQLHVSVDFGNYCDNNLSTNRTRDSNRNMMWRTVNAEIALVSASGKFLKWPDGNRVNGWCSVDFIRGVIESQSIR